MNPISQAIADLRFTIPEEILEATFVSEDMANYCGSQVSLETRIRERVIEPRVMVHMNLIGGAKTFIPLGFPATSEHIDPFTVIYYIPEELTQNRPIVQVHSVHFGILGYQNAGYALSYNEATLGAEYRKVLDSARRAAPAATSYLNLINSNTVMVRYVYLPSQYAFLSCRLGNDDELNTIRPQSILLFSELVEHAVKSYIYQRMNIRVDQAYLYGGRELGTFKETIQEYRDSEQLYKETLKRWRIVSRCFNDPEGNRHHLRTVVAAP
jgi:hypothetical protein